MKKIILLPLFLISFSIITFKSYAQQPNLGMLAHVNSGLKYISSKSDGPYQGINGTGYGYFGEGNVSFLGLFQTKNRFYIGDYIGGGISLCSSKYKNPNLHGYYIDFNVAFGGQAAYSINNDIDVGIRFIYDAKVLLVGSDQSPQSMLLPMKSICARYKNFYGDLGFGSNTEISNSLGSYYSSFVSNIRYLIKEREKYFGLRIENLHYDYLPTGRKDQFFSMTLNFGIMY